MLPLILHKKQAAVVRDIALFGYFQNGCSAGTMVLSPALPWKVQNDLSHLLGYAQKLLLSDLRRHLHSPHQQIYQLPVSFQALLTLSRRINSPSFSPIPLNFPTHIQLAKLTEDVFNRDRLVSIPWPTLGGRVHRGSWDVN